jgi:hypothetical protein
LWKNIVVLTCVEGWSQLGALRIRAETEPVDAAGKRIRPVDFGHQKEIPAKTENTMVPNSTWWKWGRNPPENNIGVAEVGPPGVAGHRVGSPSAVIITADRVRALFDSDLPDPQLVVVEGRAEVVPGSAPEDQGLVVATRRELLEQFGGTPPAGKALDDLAQSLQVSIDTLGG